MVSNTNVYTKLLPGTVTAKNKATQENPLLIL